MLNFLGMSPLSDYFGIVDYFIANRSVITLIIDDEFYRGLSPMAHVSSEHCTHWFVTIPRSFSTLPQVEISDQRQHPLIASGRFRDSLRGK
jgi:hypothetical protein